VETLQHQEIGNLFLLPYLIAAFGNSADSLTLTEPYAALILDFPATIHALPESQSDVHSLPLKKSDLSQSTS
jgi:hypothetical protein